MNCKYIYALVYIFCSQPAIENVKSQRTFPSFSDGFGGSRKFKTNVDSRFMSSKQFQEGIQRLKNDQMSRLGIILPRTATGSNRRTNIKTPFTTFNTIENTFKTSLRPTPVYSISSNDLPQVDNYLLFSYLFKFLGLLFFGCIFF